MITLQLTEEQAAALRGVMEQLGGSLKHRAERESRRAFIIKARQEHPEWDNFEIAHAASAAGHYSARTVIKDIAHSVKRYLQAAGLPVEPKGKAEVQS